MNIRNITITILVLAMSLLVAGCGSGQIFGPTVTLTPTTTPLPTATNTPTATFTPVATLTPSNTPDFYTKEERDAAKIIWTLKTYNMGAASDDGSTMCLTLVPGKEIKTGITFSIPEPRKDTIFYYNHFTKSSPNNWTTGVIGFGTGNVNYSRTLQIQEDQIIDTEILISPSGATTTCVQNWIPKGN